MFRLSNTCKDEYLNENDFRVLENEAICSELVKFQMSSAGSTKITKLLLDLESIKAPIVSNTLK